MGVEDESSKVVRGRIPWKGGKAVEKSRQQNTPKEEGTFDFSEMKKYFEAAEKRAGEIVITTSDCDLSRAEMLRDNLLHERQLTDIAAIVMGASKVDIEFDPEGYHAAALAVLMKAKSPDNFVD